MPTPANASTAYKKQISTIATNFCNVLHHEAKGDGITDDTAAIQAAIDSLTTTTGGTIFFPAGIYVITSTITYAGHNLHLIGESKHGHTGNTPGSIIKLSGMTADIGIDINSDTGLLHNGPYIRNMGFLDGDGDTTTADNGNRLLRIQSINRWTVDNCWFRGAYIGLEASGQSDARTISAIPASTSPQSITVTGHGLSSSGTLKIRNSNSVPRIDGNFSYTSSDENTLSVNTGITTTSTGNNGDAAEETDAAWGAVNDCNFKNCRIGFHSAGNFCKIIGGDYSPVAKDNIGIASVTAGAEGGDELQITLDSANPYFEQFDIVTIKTAGTPILKTTAILQKISSTVFIIDDEGVSIDDADTVTFNAMGQKNTTTNATNIANLCSIASDGVGIAAVNGAEVNVQQSIFEDTYCGIVIHKGVATTGGTNSIIMGCYFDGSATDGETGVRIYETCSGTMLLGNRFVNLSGTGDVHVYDASTYSIRLDSGDIVLQKSANPEITIRDDDGSTPRALVLDGSALSLAPNTGQCSIWMNSAVNNWNIENRSTGNLRFYKANATAATALTLSPNGFPVLPSFAVGSLPTGVTGGLIMVTGASTGTTLCYYNGSNWVDAQTDTTVTA